MYQYGALFGLLYGVTADVHQCLDDIVEGVDIVVVQHQMATDVIEHGCVVLRLCLVLFHI